MAVQDFIFVAGFVVTLLVQSFSLWQWFSNRMHTIERERDEAVDALHGRVSKLREEFNEFRLEVVQHYASDDRLRATEDRLTTSIDKLVNRFDAFTTDFQATLREMLTGNGSVKTRN